METTQAEINKRLKSLEKRVDAYNRTESTDTRQIHELAEEYRQIMDDFNDSLLAADLDFLLR